MRVALIAGVSAAWGALLVTSAPDVAVVVLLVGVLSLGTALGLGGVV